ncbi:MAG: M23 family metallopeptidase [Candidatus Eiseniibacteriota bacterium]|nr:MAG: M23 family metallopeptidase [Candidatus Eisenbacteria bacterium]
MVRRKRTGQFTGLGQLIVLLVVVCAVLTVFWRISARQKSAASFQSMDSTNALASAVPELHSESDTLRSGGSLHASLLGKHISAEDITGVLSTLGSVIDLKRSLPGESYELVTDGEGSLKRLRYCKTPGEVFVVEPAEDGLTVFQENIPLTKIVRKVEGVIKLSLYDAVCASGGDAELAVLLSDIFAWDIDFFTDPREGDRFCVLFEQYRRGEYNKSYGRILTASYNGKEISKDAFLFQLANGKSGYFDEKGQSLRRAFLRSPLNYRRISSYFTNRRFHPILKRYRPHHGIDYAASYGTPIVSVGEGTVTYAGWKGGYGRFVSVRHNSTYTTTYGHLSKFGKGIVRGARVKQGQVIGYVGSSGLSTGPHLDFRMTRNGSFINPLRLKVPSLDPVPKGELETFRSHVRVLTDAMNELSSSQSLEFVQFERWFFPDTTSHTVVSR